MLTDLLAASRRAARCEGTLLSFEIGRTLEKRALYVLWWLAERRLLTAEDALALAAVLDRDPLSLTDIAKATAHEERLLRTQLPVNPDIGSVWSRSQTETLLAQQLAGFRAALEKGKVDWKATGDAASRPIDKEDEKYLLDAQAMRRLESSGQEAAMAQARLVPLYDNGISAGFKLFAIKNDAAQWAGPHGSREGADGHRVSEEGPAGRVPDQAR